MTSISKAEYTKTNLRQHLETKGFDNNFQVTPTLCELWWFPLNHAIFNGTLSPPQRFECKAYIKNHGWVLPWRKNSNVRSVRIGICTGMKDWVHFLEILAHEMVHQWEWEVLRLPWDTVTQHGPSYLQQVEFIGEEFGLWIDT